MTANIIDSAREEAKIVEENARNRIKDACKRWINRDFNAIPGSLIEKAYPVETLNDGEGLELLAGGRYECPDCGIDSDEIFDEPTNRYRCECGWEGTFEELNHVGAEYAYPAGWGTLFNPSNSSDDDWLRDNAQEVAKVGFLVYDCDETGILLGIDGGGYDFYEAHWTPLYKLRGLRWHDTD